MRNSREEDSKGGKGRRLAAQRLFSKQIFLKLNIVAEFQCAISRLPSCSWVSNVLGPVAVCRAVGDDDGEMFVKSILQVGPSPKVAPHSSLHVSLTIKVWPQNFVVRETQISAEVC